NGTFTTLDDPKAANGTFASDSNTSGTVIGSYSNAGFFFEGYIEKGGVYTTLDEPLATTDTVLHGINASGMVVGSYYNGSGSQGFIYNPSAGTYTTLNDPLAATTDGTTLTGINNAPD